MFFARTFGALTLAGTMVLACNHRSSNPPDERVWGGKRRRGPKIVMDRAKVEKGDPAALLDMLDTELQTNFAFNEDKIRLVGGISYKEDDVDTANRQGFQTTIRIVECCA